MWLYYTNQFTRRHDYINRAMSRNTLMDEYRTIRGRIKIENRP